jgi:hypothetical protein
VSKSTKFAFAPSEAFALIREAPSMEATGTQLHYSLSSKSLEQLWRILVTFDISMTGYTILFVAPSVD